MEMEENLDEIFDLNPINILPDQILYSSDDQPLILSNYCTSDQKIIITKPSSSAAVLIAPQLISFESSSNTSYLPNYSDTAHNYNSNLEMDKDYNSLTSQIIKFSSCADQDESTQYYDDVENGININMKRVCTANRTPLQAQDHVMAERKRRQNLTRLFVSLSKVVPGLKKLDKVSLLEDAINHLKALQERVKILEEKKEIKRSSSIDIDDYNESSTNNNTENTIESVDPEIIKVRISNKHVLIKIYCKKQNGLMSRIPSEMEKMNLSVMDMRIMPFGGAALDITIHAEMQKEFGGTVKDIVDQLHTVLLNPRNSVEDDHH
ncbi:hypothetical protein DH2020_022827 [Rehmannia glutinosa]|uniref:BHLH domain-containing protein n=1 Tax=Rehmannia glutinosa TaxID=99300 RepID=A0ABR0W620_REHGL